jgi:hypothetical protein
MAVVDNLSRHLPGEAVETSCMMSGNSAGVRTCTSRASVRSPLHQHIRYRN